MSHRMPTGRLLGEAHGWSDEDPFGPGDPVDAARVVRRALAAAHRKAFEVGLVVVLAEPPADPTAVRRFVRRALGPHGEQVRLVCRDADPSQDPAATFQPVDDTLRLEVLMGPAGALRVRCLG